MKWSVFNIIKFLNIYQQYPLLWNINKDGHCDQHKKMEMFQCLFNELKEKKLLGTMNVKDLKSKIKSIKDVIRQELRKVEKSRLSGCSGDEVYMPRLVWYQEASYLVEVMATRSRRSLDLSQNSQVLESVKDENSESCTESFASEDNNRPSECCKTKSSVIRRPQARPSKRIRKRASESFTSEISEVHQMDNIAQNVSEEKPYEQFGQYVASELRQLSQRQAILLQEEIQNCIIRSKLASLDQVVIAW